MWTTPGVTTYRYKNHTARSAGWRYIRYANGDEELYDEVKDPNEYVNLAGKPEFAAHKAELAAFLPKTDAPDTEPPSSGRAASAMARSSQTWMEGAGVCGVGSWV